MSSGQAAYNSGDNTHLSFQLTEDQKREIADIKTEEARVAIYTNDNLNDFYESYNNTITRETDQNQKEKILGELNGIENICIFNNIQGFKEEFSKDKINKFLAEDKTVIVKVKRLEAYMDFCEKYNELYKAQVQTNNAQAQADTPAFIKNLNKTDPHWAYLRNEINKVLHAEAAHNYVTKKDKSNIGNTPKQRNIRLDKSKIKHASNDFLRIINENKQDQDQENKQDKEEKNQPKKQEDKEKSQKDIDKERIALNVQKMSEKLKKVSEKKKEKELEQKEEAKNEEKNRKKQIQELERKRLSEIKVDTPVVVNENPENGIKKKTINLVILISAPILLSLIVVFSPSLLTQLVSSVSVILVSSLTTYLNNKNGDQINGNLISQEKLDYAGDSKSSYKKLEASQKQGIHPYTQESVSKDLSNRNTNISQPHKKADQDLSNTHSERIKSIQ